jgi:hypothetical protein
MYVDERVVEKSAFYSDIETLFDWCKVFTLVGLNFESTRKAVLPNS